MPIFKTSTEELAAFSAEKVLRAFDFERGEVLDPAAADRLFEVADQLLTLAGWVYQGRQFPQELPAGLVYDPTEGAAPVNFNGVEITLHFCGDTCGCEFNGLTIAGRRVQNTPWGYSFG